MNFRRTRPRLWLGLPLISVALLLLPRSPIPAASAQEREAHDPRVGEEIERILGSVAEELRTPDPTLSENWRPLGEELGLLLDRFSPESEALRGRLYARVGDRWLPVRLESDRPRGVVPAGE